MRKSTLLKTMLLLCALVAGSSSVWAVDVVDQLNKGDFKATSSSYTDFSDVKKNTAVYAGRTSVQNTSIGMKRDASNGAGIFTTASGGVAKSLSFTWTSTSDRTLQVWGKNSAYSLDDTKNQNNFGTKIAEVTYNSNNTSPTLTLNSTTEYEYILIVPSSTSMLSIKDVEITWEVAGGVHVGIQSVDFEATALSHYSNWTFDNVGIHTGVTGVSAHGGSQWGSNVNSGGSGVTTCSITTKAKIAYPGTFTCYISKESDNVKSSTWKIQTSSDGSTWTDIDSKDATGMSKGEWQEFTADLSARTNVFVRLSYSGSSAIRAVDDITLTEYVPYTMNNYQWSTLVSERPLDFTGSTVKAYIVTGNEGNVLTKTQMTGIVPANTPLLLNATAGAHKITVAASNPTDISGNKLVAGTGDEVSAVEGKTRYVLSVENDEATFLKIAGTAATVPVGKAYLELDGSVPAPTLSFGDATSVNDVISKTEEVRGEYFNLNGQRVAQPTKGLCIVNGKKVIIK